MLGRVADWLEEGATRRQLAVFGLQKVFDLTF